MRRPRPLAVRVLLAGKLRKVSVRMFTNQAADPNDPLPPDLRCHHSPGAAEYDTCPYLRALARLRTWSDRAESVHRHGAPERALISELSLIYAEIASTLDRCPNARVAARMPALDAS